MHEDELLERPWLGFLILIVKGCKFVSVTFEEGEYFLDDLYDEWGDIYVLETAPQA